MSRRSLSALALIASLFGVIEAEEARTPEMPANWSAAPYWRPGALPASGDPAGPGDATDSTVGPDVVLTGPLPFAAVSPCRLADTRGLGFTGPFGPPSLAGGVTRDFPVAGYCSIPSTAKAVSVNLTVTNTTGSGFLSAWPAGTSFPGVSNLNYVPGQTIANSAILPLGSSGLVSTLSFANVDLIIDVNGYYAPAAAVSTLNGLYGDVALSAGNNVTIVPSGNTLTISATGGPGSGVPNVNGITGAVTVAGTGGTTVSTAGSTITISSSSSSGGTVSGVTAGQGLTGGGTSGNVTLAVQPAGITTPLLADSAVTSSKIAPGQAVKTVNGITDGVTLAAGTNVTITPSGSTLTIAATGSPGGTGVPSVNGITGAVTIAGSGSASVGTSGSTISVAVPTSLPPSGVAGGSLTGTFPSPSLASNSVGTAQIVDGSINGVDIANATVTGANIAGGQVVKSLNGLFDGVSLVGGSNVTITPSGNTITIASVNSGGGVPSVNGITSAVSIVGNGAASVNTSGSTVSVSVPSSLPPSGAAGGALAGSYPNPALAANSVGSTQITDGSVGTAELAAGSITSAKIAAGQVVKSLNGLFDGVNLVAGSNVTIAPSGNSLTISSLASGSGVPSVNGITSAVLIEGTGAAFVSSSGGTISVAVPVNLPPSGAAGGALAGFYPSPALASNSVASAQIVDGSIVGADIAMPFSSTGYSGSSPAFRIDNGGGGYAMSANGSSGTGLYASSSFGYGINAYSANSNGIYTSTGSSSATALYATNPVGSAAYGVTGAAGGYAGMKGQSTSATSHGVVGTSNGTAASGGIGVFGISTGGGFAGWFTGGVYVNGSLGKAGGSFKIDHPLDPSNKYLYHSFVESPDMMNIYNGVLRLDDRGEATVTLPSWFEALNSDFRYQLTPLGQPAPDLHIADEIHGGTFRVGGGRAGQRISWQVTGIRQDEWAKAHRIPVEEEKVGVEKGTYLHPELFGAPEELRLESVRYPDQLRGAGQGPGDSR